ncbi:MAG: energy transducer TonB, partial [Candidatus Eremiobacteraeota bacterium]|nr:energy transducer TonB [Candidatus Eremiobacteraeota bacterium]
MFVRTAAVLTGGLAIASLGAQAASASPTPVRMIEAASVSSHASNPAHLKNDLYAEEPAICKMERLSGTSIVLIELDEKGVARTAKVYSTSGNRFMDASALHTARAAAYIPEM